MVDCVAVTLYFKLVLIIGLALAAKTNIILGSLNIGN